MKKLTKWIRSLGQPASVSSVFQKLQDIKVELMEIEEANVEIISDCQERIDKLDAEINVATVEQNWALDAREFLEKMEREI